MRKEATPWWNQEVNDAIEAKKVAHAAEQNPIFFACEVC